MHPDQLSPPLPLVLSRQTGFAAPYGTVLVWMHCGSGRLDAYLRLVYFQNYLRKLFPASPEIDELNAPDGSTSGLSGLMRYRANFGSSWTGRRLGFGFDGHYYYHRILLRVEWLGQGSDRIDDFWQFDIHAQSELSKWLPMLAGDHELTLQWRVNNILGREFPRYAQDASGAGVQAYGDWRGRTYSLSLTAKF